MTAKEDSIMLKVVKPLVVILFTTIIGLLTYLYQEAVIDIKAIDVKMHRLDSLALDNFYQNKINKKTDSIQTAYLVESVKELKLKIEELER